MYKVIVNLVLLTFLTMGLSSFVLASEPERFGPRQERPGMPAGVTVRICPVEELERHLATMSLGTIFHGHEPGVDPIAQLFENAIKTGEPIYKTIFPLVEIFPNGDYRILSESESESLRIQQEYERRNFRIQQEYERRNFRNPDEYEGDIMDEFYDSQYPISLNSSEIVQATPFANRTGVDWSVTNFAGNNLSVWINRYEVSLENNAGRTIDLRAGSSVPLSPWNRFIRSVNTGSSQNHDWRRSHLSMTMQGTSPANWTVWNPFP